MWLLMANMLLQLVVVGPHSHDLYLATFGRSATVAAIRLLKCGGT
jgi:hypothetical protein